MSRLDETLIEKIKYDYQFSDLKVEEIANKYGISVSTIYKKCKGYRRNSTKGNTKKNILEAVEEYKNTYIPIEQIAEKYNTSSSTIWHYAGDFRRGDANKGRKYTLNEKKIMIDSREKFYWLGFIAADGCIPERGTLAIELKSADKSHLQKFCDFLETNKPIKDRINNQNVECSRITINSVNITEYLEQYNIVPNKSKIFTIPTDKIPDYYILDFVRGMIDGDGCIRINNHQQINLNFYSGNKICCEQVAKILGIDNKVYYSGNVWRIQVTGNIKAQKILDKLYEHSSEKTRLDRKYNIYKDHQLSN